MRNVIVALWLLALPSLAAAVELRGRVVDREGQPLVGALVQAADAAETRTAADGSFVIDVGRLPVDLSVSADGYYGETIEARGAEVVLRLTRVIPLRESVLVAADLAQVGKTPRSFTNVTQPEIDTAYWAQDVPMMLTLTPNLYASSDNGNGIGYSYLKLRGFDQRRVSVLINGIPHNDPEGGDVFWIDYPDLLSGVESIQIQRGVGSTLAGASNLGGFINVETTRPALQRSFTFAAGVGSYDTQRYSLKFDSGLLPGSWAFSGRLSKITSDGYRDLSWTNSWAYFASIEKLGQKSVQRFHFYGGPEQTHLAYLGVTSDYLDGAVTGDPREDRKENFLAYPGELDHFNQPHVEWLSDWQLSSTVTLSSAVYYIKGSGYYEQFRTNRAYWQFNLEPFYLPDGTYVDHTDLVRRRLTDQRQIGLVTRLAWNLGRHTLSFGGDLQRHEDRHYGYVTWGAILPPGTEPEHPYYDYKIAKWSGSASARDSIKLSDSLTGVFELQFKGGRYEMKDDRFKNVAFETGFPLLSPRAGIVYSPTQHQTVFANVAMSSREPGFRDIYDPQDPYAVPLFARSNPYRDPLIDPERVYDLEAGWALSRERFALNLTAFRMDFRNEVIYGGQVDDNGNPITGNAEKSVHQGIEGGFSAKLPYGAYATGNASWNRNTLVTYTEHTWDGPQVLDGNALGGFPTYLVNVGLGLDHAPWAGEVRFYRVGKQYMDNTENERLHPERRAVPGYVDKIVDPYTVVNLYASYRLPIPDVEARVKVYVNNVFDNLYEFSGYVEEGVPYWMPAATRNAFGLLEVRF